MNAGGAPLAAPRIEVRGVSGDAGLRRRIETKVGRIVGRLRVAPVRPQVVFDDGRLPKGGGATRCAVTVRVPYRPSLRVEHVDATARGAFDGALAGLEREVARYETRARTSRRRPKKYYAAKRVLEFAGGPSRGSRRTRP